MRKRLLKSLLIKLAVERECLLRPGYVVMTRSSSSMIGLISPGRAALSSKASMSVQFGQHVYSVRL